MPIWTFDLPDDAQPNLILDLSSLSVVTAPGVGRTVTVEADELLEPLLDVTADGAMVIIRQTALVGRERFAGIWPWGPETSRVRVTVPDRTRLDASIDAGLISAEHRWEQVRVRTSAGSIRLGDCVSAQVHADAGSIVIGTLHDGSVRAQAGSVRIRSTTGTVSAHTEAGSVKVLEAYEGFLDLSSQLGTVSVGVPEGTAVLADCHSEFGRVSTDLPRQRNPESLERRLELRARAQMGTIRIRRA